MSTLLQFYKFSLVFTLICLGLAVWYGFASTGTVVGMLGLLWIVVILSILEVSLSFDNAVVNATVLKDMSEVWQQRFLVWGIAIAVFGTRIIFPLAIVAIAAGLGPLAAVDLSLNNPQEYERIVSGAHVGIAGFGGAFLTMVGLKFFFDADKEVHWIAVVEEKLTRVSALPAVEIGLLLLVMWGISTLLPAEEALTFLTAGLLGVVTYIAGSTGLIEEIFQKVPKEYNKVDGVDYVIFAYMPNILAAMTQMASDLYGTYAKDRNNKDVRSMPVMEGIRNYK
ncbi:MAG: DUF475 domain-containing protein, partial [Alphaproteobacteria bacterium]|nr:DUF475 domain-containing protein [Alphaproteobacteria bacterium]